ncbi:MAG TPA: hypothetical protein PLZ49_07320 [Bacillota bacterium]|nr:hypothetical protein [Bacillota bacterium]HOL15989.1 hypothetical protein [Bacillota bacterium]
MDVLVVGSSDGFIENCYSAGLVEGNDRVGGLVGLDNSDSIVSSFWDIQTSVQLSSAGREPKTLLILSSELSLRMTLGF